MDFSNFNDFLMAFEPFMEGKSPALLKNFAPQRSELYARDSKMIFTDPALEKLYSLELLNSRQLDRNDLAKIQRLAEILLQKRLDERLYFELQSSSFTSL